MSWDCLDNTSALIKSKFSKSRDFWVVYDAVKKLYINYYNISWSLIICNKFNWNMFVYKYSVKLHRPVMPLCNRKI